jgi:hypothetical protein
MTTWKADVFVNSQVGKISTEVEAATFSGAKEQIYAKHGDVQQIYNLRQVSSDSSSGFTSSSGGSTSGSIALVGLVAAGWAFITFTPWILMFGGGIASTWIIQKLLRTDLESASDSGNNGAVALILGTAILFGGVGFVQGEFIRKSFETTETPPTQIQKQQ